MSLAQRLAWLEVVSTLAILSAVMLTSVPPEGIGGMGVTTATAAAAAQILPRFFIIMGICFVCFYFCDLYNFEDPHDFGDLFGRLCRALGWSALLLATTYVVFPTTIVRGNFVSHALMLLLVAVLLIRSVVYSMAKRAPFSERVLIMGVGTLATVIADQIRTRPDLAVRLIGVLSDGGTATTLSAPRLGRYDDVADVVRRHRPDRIIVAMPDRRSHLPVTQLLACRVRGVRIEDGPQVLERFTRRLAVESLTPSALIFGDGFRVTRAQLLVKRVMSVAIAIVALVLTAPFMAVVALGITLESRGPVFFVQERVGLHGRLFRLVKFRTMRVLDARETDNILRGDMSLVGPRPEMAENVATFSTVIPYYNLRHEVRPGLTGWAQVRAGYSMSVEEVTRKLCYDLYYIKHMCAQFDLRILFDTVKFVLSGKRPGAGSARLLRTTREGRHEVSQLRPVRDRPRHWRWGSPRPRCRERCRSAAARDRAARQLGIRARRGWLR